MSRISGIIADEGKNPELLISNMLKSSLFNETWHSYVEHIGAEYFGWCGWTDSNISKNKNIICTIDGKIYNKDSLGNAENDAELIIKIYQKQGFEETVKKINGDCSIALYDQDAQTLWLSRDRFGVKPLYYVHKDYFAFASRPRALFKLPDITKEVNQQMVAIFASCHYRYFHNNPETSLYHDIMQVPAAHILKVNNNKITKIKYWTLENLIEFTSDEKELSEKYKNLLLDSIAIRLKTAKNPAFTLSGGMDSSSILAFVKHITGKKHSAFSAVHTDKTYDESEEIKSTVDACVDEWNPILIDHPDIFSVASEMIELNDGPVATATWLSHYLLCREVAKKNFNGVFSGLGGDELNAGEYEHFIYHFADLKLKGLDESLNEEVKTWIKYHDHPIFKKNLEALENYFSTLVDFKEPGKCLPDKKMFQRYHKALSKEYSSIIQNFKPIMDNSFNSYLKNKTIQHIFREMLPCCLRANDAHTTAFDIDSFFPFLDYRLAEFMMRIPGELKIRNGVTKYLLREATKGILPEETRTRIKKMGWNAPAHLWFCREGKEKLLELADSKEFKERGIYDSDEIKKIIDEHEKIVLKGENKENHMMFLWQMMNVELWLRWLEKI